ncbi:MAG: response regulator transcription factor [Candidatus Eremiobacteraeota bacterium]|nr:response regulator transcription factor [Candidatus Eremiobacteraeota bacterium]
MISVVIAEDQQLVAGALAALLGLEPDIEVVGHAHDGPTALRRVDELNPDVLLADIEMPLLTGLDVAAELRRRESKTRVIIVTTFARPGYLRRAMDAGVAGYLLKDRPVEELVAAVRTVHAGGRAIDPSLAVHAWTEPDPLTDRERAVLRLAGDGQTSAAIGAVLGLSEGTVRNYLSEAIGKVGGSNRTEAARIARDRGWL